MNRSQRGTTQSWEAASTAATAGFRTRLLQGAAWALSVALLVGCAGTEDAPAPATGGAVQAFTNANIFDGTGAPVVQNGTILVQDGRITEVGANVQVPEGAEVVDLGGRFVMPGMINGHAHVDPNPSGPNPQEQLEQYAHYGVTTVLSLGEMNSQDALNLREHSWMPQADYARVLAAGRIYTPLTPEDAVTVVDSLAALNVDWVKIRVDDFLDTQTKMPPEAYQALIARATEHNLPVAVHMVELEDAKGVLRAGADLIAHSVRDVPVDQEFIDLLLQNDVCVIPTLTREMSTYAYAQRPEWFDDPFFLERAAPTDVEGYITPELQQAQQSPAAQWYQEHLEVAEQNMLRLRDAGVKIGFGTDTGTGFPGRFQGYLEHLELQMMVDAGFTPEQALLAATGQTAECIDLAGQVGTLVPGAWADFVVLNASPLENIENSKQVHSVWMSGQQFDRAS